ncbi:unnamed protein product [Acanthoscelides obtectus]|uniref:SESTD1-like spectrin repeats region domain-containing protein n=1 Tax=Acanthoscelides obtectus TaxID=200917 RepID=A0A9P0KKW6_ACAOB|nr:unnamed protein product [Acanthoscelides obtectus]CAK1646380.1 SEC14 domain and spectrin repeat-containing protein 1 [Acanthoscelides obtectus]
MECDARKVSSLEGRLVVLPGGRDKEGHPLVLITVPVEASSVEVEPSLQYLLSLFSETSRLRGLTVIIDGRKGPWKVARACIRQVNAVFSAEELAQCIVLRPDAFWDKQRVEYCTSSQKDKEVIFIPRSRLNKYVDQSQLPVELGGNFVYDHDRWIETRKKVEDFYVDSSVATKELEELYDYIQKSTTFRAIQVEQAIRTGKDMLESATMLASNTTETGKEIIDTMEQENKTRKLAAEDFDLTMSSPQESIDTIDRVSEVISNVKKKKEKTDAAWAELEKIHEQTRSLIELEEMVSNVVDWILNYGDFLMNSRQEVPYDVTSADHLKREHESIELQCWETYGVYAELISEIGKFSDDENLSPQHTELLAQKEYMDYVCKSFAGRLETRRNIVTTSLRFYSLVAEYYEKTAEVFDQLIRRSNVADFESAAFKLRELKENQDFLDAIQHELVKEGEKLSELLLLPVKDTLGKDLSTDYTEDIFNLRDVIEGTNARRNIFTDSVEFQKITLEQVIHIDNYEKYTHQAIQWLDELLQILMKEHSEVGCTVYELQKEKEAHQGVIDTAKSTYHYGCKLLNASLVLRQSCRLPLEDHANLYQKLRSSWQRIFAISQEQMTRLRVSTVFHRSIEEQMNRLRDLREAVATILLMDSAIKMERVNYYFGVREKLMLEVGRTVRVGRLLKSRLKEPLYQNEKLLSSFTSVKSEDFEKSVSFSSGNETAIEAITEKLTEVTLLAEELEQALLSAEQDCLVFATTSKLTFSNNVTKNLNRKSMEGRRSSTEPKPQKPEDLKSDEEFVTASESTLQHSRSSSYNTASECEQHHAPWWEHGKECPPHLAKQKMVLGVGLPDLPPPEEVLKPSPEPPPGKIAREVVETTHIKVRQQHTMGVSSFVLTSETVRDKRDDVVTTREEVVRVTDEHGNEVVVSVPEREVDLADFEKRMKEVGVSSEEKAWRNYQLTKQAMKGFVI